MQDHQENAGLQALLPLRHSKSRLCPGIKPLPTGGELMRAADHTPHRSPLLRVVYCSHSFSSLARASRNPSARSSSLHPLFRWIYVSRIARGGGTKAFPTRCHSSSTAGLAAKATSTFFISWTCPFERRHHCFLFGAAMTALSRHQRVRVRGDLTR